MRQWHENDSLPVRGAPFGFVFVNRHAVFANSSKPAHTRGIERVTASAYVWKRPAAQLGVQSF